MVRIVDELGFDKEPIYIQSKCRQNIEYHSTSTEVREFLGACIGKQAKKAVFITNGIMHKDTIKECASNKIIMLIDGDKLADLMIKYHLGIRMSDNNLPVIDEGFFPIAK